MAAHSTVKQAAHRIAELVRAYAAEKQWSDTDYEIYMRSRPGGILHLIVVALAGKLKGGGSTWMDYYDLSKYLEQHVEPDLQKNLRISIRSFDQVKEGGIYAINSDYRKYIVDTSRSKYVFRRIS